jgi:hypothetical protein
MIYLCPQRGCSGVHNLTQDDVGRSFTCNKCNSMLRFDGDGLRMLSPPPSPGARPGRPGPPERAGPPPTEEDEDVPVLSSDESGSAPPPPPVRRSESNPQSRNPPPMSPNGSPPAETRVLDVLFTGLYALGACFIILFLFLPLLDRANAVKKSTEIDTGQIKQDRIKRDREREDRERMENLASGKVAGASDKDLVERQKEDIKRAQQWSDTRGNLTDDVRQMEASARSNYYFYLWGMLFGFLILAFASAGFVAAGSTPTRRLLGILTLLIEVLVVFVIFFSANIYTTFDTLQHKPPYQQPPPQTKGFGQE